jgi:hypothetical protein
VVKFLFGLSLEQYSREFDGFLDKAQGLVYNAVLARAHCKEVHLNDDIWYVGVFSNLAYDNPV